MQPFSVVQGTVVVLTIGGGEQRGDAVVCIATTEQGAKDIADGLNLKFAEKLINGEV
jgi:hypothetical protein